MFLEFMDRFFKLILSISNTLKKFEYLEDFSHKSFNTLTFSQLIIILQTLSKLYFLHNSLSLNYAERLFLELQQH